MQVAEDFFLPAFPLYCATARSHVIRIAMGSMSLDSDFADGVSERFDHGANRHAVDVFHGRKA